MKIQLLATIVLLSATLAQTTTQSQNQTATTSAQNPNPLNCSETEIALKGVCVDVGSCATSFQYFKQKKQGTGKDQLPNKPDFGISLETSGNLKLDLTFQNATGLSTSLEGSNCLSVSLSRFSAGFVNEVVDSSTIQSTLNTNNSRTWSLIIEKSNFDSYLAKDVQTNFTNYQGFYALNVNITVASQSKQVVQFAFRFGANFTSDLSQLLGFEISPKLRGQPVCADDAQTKCVQQAASTLILCGTDSTCATTSNSTDLVVDETYYIKQQITEDGFNDGKWRPGDANITVTASGVTKLVKPKIVNQTADGTIYEIKFKFLANNVTIASDAAMAQTSARRLLTDVSDASATGTTTTTCVKTSSDASCPTTEEVTTYNSENCVDTSCDDEGTSNQIILSFGIIMIALIM